MSISHHQKNPPDFLRTNQHAQIPVLHAQKNLQRTTYLQLEGPPNQASLFLPLSLFLLPLSAAFDPTPAPFLLRLVILIIHNGFQSRSQDRQGRYSLHIDNPSRHIKVCRLSGQGFPNSRRITRSESPAIATGSLGRSKSPDQPDGQDHRRFKKGCRCCSQVDRRCSRNIHRYASSSCIRDLC